MSRTEIIYEFADMLRNHDWFYVMSDDHRVYKNGSYNEERIQSFMDECEYEDIKPVLQAMFNAVSDDNKITTV